MWTTPTIQITPSKTASATSTASAAPKTVENGDVISDAAVGMIITAGVGGGFLLLAGQYFSMSAGSVALVTGIGGVASGLSSLAGSQPQQVDSPENDRPEDDVPEERQPTATGQKSRELETTTQPLVTSLASSYMTSFTTSSTAAYSTTSYISSSSSPVPQYIIVPGFNNAESGDDSFASVRSRLSDAAGSEVVSVEDEEDNSVLFLTAPLSPEAASELSNEASLESVSKDFILGEMDDLQSEPPFKEDDVAGPSGSPPAILTDPLTVAKQPKKIVRQIGYDGSPREEKPFELSVVSQEPGKRMADFTYDEVAGRGVTVYILGSGMNLQSPDIKQAVGGKEFIYAPGAAETPTDDDPDMGYPDGTCMASKIFGPKYGVAKNANVIMVKLSGQSGMMQAITFTEMLTALAMVKNDVHRRGIKGKAVVSLSYTTPIADKEAIEAYKEILVKMMEDDIVLVAPTGISNNNRGSEANNQYPAAFAKDTALIAVNAVNSKGFRYNWSPGSVEDGVTVAASGIGYCAWRVAEILVGKRREKQEPDRLYYSESVAAATVAGVAATLMAQEEYKAQLQQPGKVASKVKELLQGLAWVRAEGGPPVVWNGVRSMNGVCRRQEGDSCSSAAPTATPTTSEARLRPTTPVSVVPVACDNFNKKKYGYCCPGPGNPCHKGLGVCYVNGEGVSGGSSGVVPNGAQCPPPAGAEY
ncbi:hypothetical protein CH063_00036 [Colletotrichum higginsianum]|nr:hypothetical protein CH063_00036 [Colletotrichum higginsianum]